MGEIISSLENISEILFNNGYNSWGNTIRKAIDLLKEQENEIADKAITVDVSIPEQFWPSMRYDPSEDVVACTSCLICGKAIPLEEAPEAIVRCEDCVNSGTSKFPCHYSGDPYIDWNPDDDWFCADGEIRNSMGS